MSDRKPALNRSYGPYRCIHLVETSPEGALYYALHNRSGKMIAVRTLRLRDHNREKIIAQSRDEMARLRDLDVPHLLPLLDFGSTEDEVYLVLDYQHGSTLQERFEQRRASGELPSVGEVSRLIFDLSEALMGLHRVGIVHGQLEPRVVLFDARGRMFLSDYGLIRLLKIVYALEDSNSFAMTHYSAPELWDGNKPTAASDQYSLACLAFELLSGRPPFLGNSIADLMRAHQMQAAPSIKRLRPELPNDVDFVFWQALAKPPERRFVSVLDFGAALSNVLLGHEGQPGSFYAPSS
ncbi:MAG: serine/threonine protein kinase [Anaerolineae bacterium]|nr:serine/threonine protein kinase [Anaerolineae bacterium]MDW8173532.1 serine/threonine-protein kinase [Anaerolineae bacterium]